MVFVIPAEAGIQFFSPWTPAFAGVTPSFFAFRNRYYLALPFIGTQRGALTTLRSSSQCSTSTLVWGKWKKSCAIKPWPEFVEGLFGSITKKDGTLKP